MSLARTWASVQTHTCELGQGWNWTRVDILPHLADPLCVWYLTLGVLSLLVRDVTFFGALVDCSLFLLALADKSWAAGVLKPVSAPARAGIAKRTKTASESSKFPTAQRTVMVRSAVSSWQSGAEGRPSFRRTGSLPASVPGEQRLAGDRRALLGSERQETARIF